MKTRTRSTSRTWQRAPRTRDGTLQLDTQRTFGAFNNFGIPPGGMSNITPPPLNQNGEVDTSQTTNRPFGSNLSVSVNYRPQSQWLEDDDNGFDVSGRGTLRFEQAAQAQLIMSLLPIINMALFRQPQLAPPPGKREIYFVQALLTELGFMDGPLTGVLDEATQAAILGARAAFDQPGGTTFDDEFLGFLFAEVAQTAADLELRQVLVDIMLASYGFSAYEAYGFLIGGALFIRLTVPEDQVEEIIARAKTIEGIAFIEKDPCRNKEWTTKEGRGR